MRGMRCSRGIQLKMIQAAIVAGLAGCGHCAPLLASQLRSPGSTATGRQLAAAAAASAADVVIVDAPAAATEPTTPARLACVSVTCTVECHPATNPCCNRSGTCEYDPVFRGNRCIPEGLICGPAPRPAAVGAPVARPREGWQGAMSVVDVSPTPAQLATDAIFLGGYGALGFRDGVTLGFARGVADPIHARALYLEDAEGEALAMVVIDATGRNPCGVHRRSGNGPSHAPIF